MTKTTEAINQELLVINYDFAHGKDYTALGFLLNGEMQHLYGPIADEVYACLSREFPRYGLRAENKKLLRMALEALEHYEYNIKHSKKRIDLGLARDVGGSVITAISAHLSEGK